MNITAFFLGSICWDSICLTERHPSPAPTYARQRMPWKHWERSKHGFPEASLQSSLPVLDRCSGGLLQSLQIASELPLSVSVTWYSFCFPWVSQYHMWFRMLYVASSVDMLWFHPIGPTKKAFRLLLIPPQAISLSQYGNFPPCLWLGGLVDSHGTRHVLVLSKTAL